MPRRLLLIDDATNQRILLRAKLASAGYDVELAANLAAATRSVEAGLPDVVLFSTTLLTPEFDTFLQLLMGRTQFGRTPLILLSKHGESVSPRAEVDAILSLPVDDVLLFARLRSVLRVKDLEDELIMRANTCREMGLAEDAAHFIAKPQVLLVPPTVNEGAAIVGRLAPSVAAMARILPRGALSAHLEKRGQSDVVVLFANHGRSDFGLNDLSDLRCRAETRNAAYIFVLPRGAEAEAAMALDLGATDVVFGQDDSAVLSNRIETLLRRQTRLKALRTQVSDGLKLAVIDPLTGLHNRRYALKHLERHADHASRTKRALAVLIVDIDHFKAINDTYGHQNGDRVLIAIAKVLKENVRSADLVSRFGGEEFLITMPDTSEEEAQSVAQRLRRAAAGAVVPLDGSGKTSVTLSIGATICRPNRANQSISIDRLIGDADAALYAAKSAGRNQVTLARKAA